MKPIKEITGALDWVLADAPFVWHVSNFADVRKIWEACKGNT
jgi:hypothetical protein